MKRTLLITALLSSFAFTACKNDKKTDTSDSESTLSEKEMTSEEESTTIIKNMDLAFKTDENNQLAMVYFDLKNALVKADAKSATEAAELMMKNLQEKNQLRLAEEIAKNEGDIEVQRRAFYKLSDLLAPVFSRNITSGKLYKQYCPMAFNNEGAFWFSQEKEIMNPYFGDKMLHCGSIKETIE